MGKRRKQSVTQPQPMQCIQTMQITEPVSIIRTSEYTALLLENDRLRKECELLRGQADVLRETSERNRQELDILRGENEMLRKELDMLRVEHKILMKEREQEQFNRERSDVLNILIIEKKLGNKFRKQNNHMYSDIYTLLRDFSNFDTYDDDDKHREDYIAFSNAMDACMRLFNNEGIIISFSELVDLYNIKETRNNASHFVRLRDSDYNEKLRVLHTKSTGGLKSIIDYLLRP